MGLSTLQLRVVPFVKQDEVTVDPHLTAKWALCIQQLDNP